MTPAVTDGSGDPRTARTRGRLREALLEACAERPLDRIGVADVARRAGVGRATLYLHYDDLRALAVDACADVVREAVEALHAWGRTPPGPDAPPEELAALLRGIRGRAEVYRSLLGPGGGPLGELLHQELRQYSLEELRRRRPAGSGHDLTASAVAGLFTGMLADWVHDRTDATPEQLAGRIWRTLLAVHAAAASHGQGTVTTGPSAPLG
ncbi:TetR/AcrR family transcriptional regulator [Streptomyces sp. HB132]|uniref:TetR/AcrR family transcriptional regulator n=1 Tax=Streptomyces sp. HB132 TaxID=767388 RepID=UPI0019610A2B|nr:TetR/AcrR family transcriptional regulator [Streptomyces sp. HB132]MBM7442082.1 AcrR family transcriptional regulator [Streptomyces sp. HB132]